MPTVPLLVRTSDAKQWLGLPLTDVSRDPTLALALAGAVALIESALNGRTLAAATTTERVDGTGRAVVYVANAPITAITGVQIDQRGAVLNLGDMRSWRDLAQLHTPALTDLTADSVGGVTRHDGYVWPRGTGNIALSYTAGYTVDTFPADLRLLVLQVTSVMLRGRGKEGLQSETLGDYTWRTGSGAVDVTALPGAATVLARYRRQTV